MKYDPFVQVFIHNPHQRMGYMSGRMVANQSNHDLNMLNINQKILSLAAGRLNDAINRDSLVIGTPTNLLAYDVENNSDLFYKEVARLMMTIFDTNRCNTKHGIWVSALQSTL